ncbi:ABC transporter permease [Williamsia maris]|uniref:Prepilin-type processing-associated H-X9-DG domain-containing protein n=1 Tax=Williamsia maris TaxID=72806 RepID=A0ABT1HB83_9NOCA|nr:ABC transporter permease [Williamsia maris]MCP2175506.1 prepilin-type processing-associated H-X9-DG domain-containing protein [Williamsia maris]
MADSPARQPLRQVAVVLGLTAALSLLLLAFALPGVHSKPHDLRFGVVAAPTTSQQLARSLDTRQPGAFDVSYPASAAAARSQIESRDLDGALIVDRTGITTMVTTAGSTSVATLIEGVGTRIASSQNTTSTTVDVRGFGGGDPRGAGLAAGALPLALGGWIGALVMMMVLRNPRTLVVSTLAFAVVGGLALTTILRFVLGTFDGQFWPAAGAAMLGIAATAFGVIGLRTLLGAAGLGIAGLALIVLGNPLSGLTSSPSLLPQPWGAIGQYLPPGATGTLLRNVVFFDGHATGHATLVLLAWLIVGAAFYVIAIRRGRSTLDTAEELLDEEWGITETHVPAHARDGHVPQHAR